MDLDMYGPVAAIGWPRRQEVKDRIVSQGRIESPVSTLTAHLAMCVHLERMILVREFKGTSHRTNNKSKHEIARSPRRVIGLLAAFLVVLFGMAAGAHAQSTFGSIRGIVQDGSGAVIPGAQVTLHSIDENTDRKATSDETGNYILENVKAGKY